MMITKLFAFFRNSSLSFRIFTNEPGILFMKLCLFFLLALAMTCSKRAFRESLHYGRGSANPGCLPAVSFSDKVVLGTQTDMVLTVLLCNVRRGLKLFLSEHVSV